MTFKELETKLEEKLLGATARVYTLGSAIEDTIIDIFKEANIDTRFLTVTRRNMRSSALNFDLVYNDHKTPAMRVLMIDVSKKVNKPNTWSSYVVSKIKVIPFGYRDDAIVEEELASTKLGCEVAGKNIAKETANSVLMAQEIVNQYHITSAYDLQAFCQRISRIAFSEQEKINFCTTK